MSSTSRASRRAAAVVAALATTVTGLTLVAPPAHAVAGVFLSEINYDVPGTDTGEFVEVTAPAGTDLSGYSVVLYNGSNISASATYDTDALSGVVADHEGTGWGTFVVDYPTDGLQNGAPDGIALVNGSTVVELISYEGVLTAGNGPAAGQTSTDIGVAQTNSGTAGTTLQRQVDGTWTGPVAGTKGVPNGYGDPGEMPLDAADPGDKTGTVGYPITPFDLEATGGEEPYSWTIDGQPDGVGVSPSGTVSGTPSESGEFTVTATVTDGASDTDTVDFALDVRADDPAIDEIQGTGTTSPLSGTQSTRGVVTAAYPTGGLRGFYLQTPGTGGAIDLETHTASDGIFVYQPSFPVTVQPGDYVRVTGTVGEYAGATQLTVPSAGSVVELTDSVEPPTPVTTAWPATDAEKESLEGMLFSPEGEFTVTNNYATNQFGELGLAVGDEPLIQPTQVGPVGSPAEQAQKADNAARAIVLDDGSSTNFIQTSDSTSTCSPRPVPCLVNGDLTPPYISTESPIRVGATGTFHDDVILTQGGSPSSPTYRFQPLEQVVGPDNTAAPATFENTRPANAAPDEQLISATADADLKIASFNVLNYFTTLGDPDDDNTSEDGCVAYWDRSGDGNNVADDCDQRGAWDPEDLERQQSKIVDAINALDADVVGLMEIENSRQLGETPDEAVDSLVAALNADAGPGTWAANPSSDELPTEGLDVITNAIIFKPAAVERTGDARALGTLSDDGQAFGNAREPIAQVFTPVGGGEPFLVVVNHFKSKGSPGPFPGDEDTGDGQGASNESRIRQAQALADWVPTIQGDVDDVYLMGDFNSYAQEDPMQVLYGEGYTNLEVASGNDEYSYSFSGLSGSLDHVLANDSGTERFTGADVWNINAVEPVALEYSRYNYHATDFYEEGPFRSSDHDPVIVGITDGVDDPDPVTTPTSTTATAQPMTWGTDGTVEVTVTPATASGPVTVSEDGTTIATGTVTAGSGTVTIDGEALEPGTHTLTVAYAGNAAHDPSQTSVSVTVAEAATTTEVEVTPADLAVGDTASAQVSVTATGYVPTGEVEVSVDGDVVGTATLAGGTATVALPAFTTAGTHVVTAAYAGDGRAAASQSSTSITVAPATATVSVEHTPEKVKQGQTRARLSVQVVGEGATPTGFVRIRVAGQGSTRVELDQRGRATLRLETFRKPGPKAVTVTYLGDDRYDSATAEHTIKVVKKNKKKGNR